MIRIAIMSGKAYGKEVSNISSDLDGRTLVEEGIVIIYGEHLELIEDELGIEIQMVE